MFKDLMEKLGQCMDKLRSEHYPAAETELCSRTANALYLMLLCVNEIQKCGDERQKEAAEKCALDCAKQIEWAMNCYISADYTNRMERIAEGMRAIHSFHRANRIMNQIVKDIHADKESSTSKSDVSHSYDSDVCVNTLSANMSGDEAD